MLLQVYLLWVGVKGRYIWLWMQRSTGSHSCPLVWGAHHEAAGHGAHGWVVRGHPGAGVDQQVAADGTRVCNLALADWGAAHASPCLAQLVDLVHNTAYVTGPVLMQAGRHWQWDGGGRYSNIWWGVCVRELPGPVCPWRGLLEAIRHGWGSCTPSLGKRLWACKPLGVLQTRELSSIRYVAQILSHSLLCK